MAKLLDGFLSLARNLNKVKPDEAEQKEGIIGEPVSQLSLDKTDDELIELKNKWESRWNQSIVKKEVERKQNENEKYWLGDHYTAAQKKTGKRESVDNLIFESLETFLPVATRQIAEPLISTSNDAEAQAFARKVTDRIVDVADVIRLRLKAKKAVRHWALYFLGCLKYGWSMERNEIAVQAIRPQQLILDPDAITDECEYEGYYIGHYRTDTAADLITRFPDAAEEITLEVGKEQLGTKVRYIEWWTNDYLFWTLKDKVLGKNKNPHWNYDEQTAPSQSVDEYGNPIEVPGQTIPGNNHFSSPKMPFGFLSVFNLGKQPYDDTNLIEQVLPNQDIVNKRVRQIDKNADGTNGGAVVSGDSFTKEQAREVGEALRQGKTVWVPSGDINRAYKRDIGQSLPDFVYQSLLDHRAEIRGIFGTTGLSPQGIQKEDTVRGKILIRGQDADRASLVVDHIEQLYDYTFNWFVQLMMVYYDTPRQVSRTQGSETLVSSEFVYPLIVSVKEGSLIPKDRLTERNEAIDLWQAQAIDPIEFYKRLEFPNPYQAAKNLFLWRTNPVALFPDLASPPTEGIPGESTPPTPPSSETPPTTETPQEVSSSLLNQVPTQ